MDAEVDEIEDTDDFYNENDDDDFEETDDNVRAARRSLASIFGETEVLEVDEAQKDESLLVRFTLDAF